MEPRPPARHGAARAAHFVGNVLLGFALGIACYYGITDVMAAVAQDDLKGSLYELGPIAEEVPETKPRDPNGMAGWPKEDRAYWRSLEEGGVFGRLVIEKIGLDSVVVKGTEREHLKEGPGWIVQTDLPGERGNCAISGHRTTYGAPFRDIDQLVAGDQIVFFSPFRRYTYEVSDQLVVRPDEVEVVASTEEPMLTLTACHPPYSAAFRIIVQSRLVGVRQLEDVETDS